MTEDTEIDEISQYRAEIDAHKAAAGKMRNHLHVIRSSLLEAAKNIHTSQCRFNHDHPGQGFLADAMKSALIGASVVGQALDDLP